MPTMTAAPNPPFTPRQGELPNPIVTFEIDGKSGRRTLLQIVAVLTYESATPRDDIDAFRDLLGRGRPATLLIVELSPLGYEELLQD